MSKGDPRFLIYGLIDPRSRLIRYVGVSSSGLTRPRQHRSPSCPDSYCRSWVKTLQKIGLDYEITILESVPTQVALSDAEQWWIAFGRACGWPLTNLTNGGSAGLEAILKKRPAAIAQTNIEADRLRRFFPPEHVEAFRQSLGIPAEIERRCLQFFDENFAIVRGERLVDSAIVALCVTHATATKLYETWWHLKHPAPQEKRKGGRPRRVEPEPSRKTYPQRPSKKACFQLFKQGKSINDVCVAMQLDVNSVKLLYTRWEQMSPRARQKVAPGNL